MRTLLSEAPLPEGAFALFERDATTNGAGRSTLLGRAEKQSCRAMVPPHRHTATGDVAHRRVLLGIRAHMERGWRGCAVAHMVS